MQVNRIKHFAWCDRCLRGSPMHTYDAPLVARFFSIEELRSAGWVHVVDKRVTAKGPREDAERMWSGATYCPECAARARARAQAGGAAAPGIRRSAVTGQLSAVSRRQAPERPSGAARPTGATGTTGAAGANRKEPRSAPGGLKAADSGWLFAEGERRAASR